MDARKTKIWLGTLAAVLFVAAAATPQTVRNQMPPGPQPPAPAARGDRAAQRRTDAEPETNQTITSETALVHLDVLVVDEDGNVLGGLQKANFRLLDNGQPRAITNFAAPTAPITIAVLMEYRTDAYNYFSAKAADWGSLFLNHLEPQDWVALVTYDMKSSVRVDFTRSKAEVRDAIVTLGYPEFQEANLFDSLLDTLDRLERIKGRKSILIISTGENTFSASSLGEVLNRLRSTDVTIFCVGLAEAEYMQSSMDGGFGYLQDKNQLDTFADQTGGVAYFPRFAGELPSIFRSVATILRNQYTLGFTPELAARDGKYHKLGIQVVGPDGKPLVVTNKQGKRRKVVVTARRGYVAPKPETDAGG